MNTQSKIVSIFHQTLSLADKYVSNIQEPLNFTNRIKIGDIDYGPSFTDCIRPASEGESSIDQDSEEMQVYFPTVKEVLEYVVNPQSTYHEQGDTFLIPHKHKGILQQSLRLKDIVLKQCYFINQKYIKIKTQNRAYIKQIQALRIHQRLSYIRIYQKQWSIFHVVLRNMKQNTTFCQLMDKVKHICHVTVEDWSGLLHLRQTWNTVILLGSLKDAIKVCEQLDWKNVFNEFEIVKANMIPKKSELNVKLFYN